MWKLNKLNDRLTCNIHLNYIKRTDLGNGIRESSSNMWKINLEQIFGTHSLHAESPAFSTDFQNSGIRTTQIFYELIECCNALAMGIPLHCLPQL